MADPPSTVPGLLERFARLEEAVTRASEGQFGEALRLLDAVPQDELGKVEQAVHSFINDHRIAIEQSALSIEEFNQSRRELENKLATIEKQQAAIQRLSAPIIDVWDGIVTVPLAGELGSTRMDDLAARLLDRLQHERISWVLIDLTGAEQLDAGIAADLLRLSSAVRLMGAECLLTGMTAQAAKTLVSLGTPLERIRSISSLKEGLKLCLARSDAARAQRGAEK